MLNVEDKMSLLNKLDDDDFIFTFANKLENTNEKLRIIEKINSPLIAFKTLELVPSSHERNNCIGNNTLLLFFCRILQVNFEIESHIFLDF